MFLITAAVNDKLDAIEENRTGGKPSSSISSLESAIDRIDDLDDRFDALNMRVIFDTILQIIFYYSPQK